MPVEIIGSLKFSWQNITIDVVQAVVESGVTLRLVELLSHDKDAVVVPALRTVGNVVTGTDDQTQVVLNCNALQALYSILANAQHHKKSIIKEACWTVSNVTAGE
jgi:importin subunit alpha-6/7